MSLTQGQLAEINSGSGLVVTRTITFDGATANDVGDADGAYATSTLFTVTGLVAVKLYARVITDLAGSSATIAVGTATTAGGLLAQSTATDLDAGDIWHDATPDASVELGSVVAEKLVNQDIKQVVATADITAGVIEYTCIWRPISDGASVDLPVASASLSPSASASPSRSPSSSRSPSASTSPSASASASSSPSRSPSASASASLSPSASRSPSASTSPSASISPSSSVSPSPSPSPIP